MTITKGDWVLIRHPVIGSAWCKFTDFVTRNDGIELANVQYWDNSDRGSPRLPADYRGQWLPMNFPVTCIAKTRQSN